MDSNEDGFLLNLTSESTFSKKVFPKKKKSFEQRKKQKEYNNNHLKHSQFIRIKKSTFNEYDSGLDNFRNSTSFSNEIDFQSHTLKKGEDTQHRVNFKDNDETSLYKNAPSTTKQALHDGKKLYMSSLFNKNPDVPHVPTSFSKGKEESLFSSITFSDLDLHPHLISCLQQRMNITKVTEVQKRTIPHLLKGKDVLVKSSTGSGKTLSYAIPIVQKLQEIRPQISRSQGVFALVVLPTRELALQSYECFSILTRSFKWIVPGYLIGGEKKKSEKARIRKGINILVSTPGRLLDHQETTVNLQLHKTKWLVIDEADRLLESGFQESVIKIMSFCPSIYARQTILLSATLTKEVENLAGMSLNNPEYIDIASESATMEDLVIPSQLKQYTVIVPTKLRLVTLSAFIVDKCSKNSFKALIFMCTQVSVDFHCLLFQQMLKPMVKIKGFPIKFFKLHGDMKQEDRTEVFRRFKKTKNGILLCTDVAARGLDLPDVDWIIQYSAPVSAENYVHRVGRTARIGHEGQALLFLIPSEIKFIQLLQSHNIQIEELLYRDVLQSLLLIADVIHESSQKSRYIKAIEEHATRLQFKYEDVVYSEPTLYDSAKNAFLSFVRAYSSYPKPLRPFIPVRELHLGHLAKSFCLRESPSELGCKYMNSVKHYKKGNTRDRLPQKRKRTVEMSEYDSGLSSYKSVQKSKRMAEISEFDSGLNSYDTTYVPKNKKKRIS